MGGEGAGWMLVLSLRVQVRSLGVQVRSLGVWVKSLRVQVRFLKFPWGGVGLSSAGAGIHFQPV